jgi:hypothetical protein
VGPEDRLEMIADLLDAAPTSSGRFGRETTAACALARDEDPRRVAELLDEARRVGSSVALRCLLRLEHSVALRPAGGNRLRSIPPNGSAPLPTVERGQVGQGSQP